MDSVVSWAILTVFGIFSAGWFVWRIVDELSVNYEEDDNDYWK